MPTPLTAIRYAVKRLPGMKRLLATAWWNRFRHWRAVHFAVRKNAGFTQFLRLPTQFEALTGPVIDFLAPTRETGLRVVVMGCSNGAEVVTIASVLTQRLHDTPFEIEAFDIEAPSLAIASAGEYTQEQVRDNPAVTDEFVMRTFDVADGRYLVKPALKAHMRFSMGNLLDEAFITATPRADIVFAQNFLFHLPRRANAAAFANLCALLKPRAALFVEGMDHDLRVKLTRRAGLTPLPFEVEQIHAEGRMRRADFWPWRYMGLEPYYPKRRDPLRWYGTIFLRGA